MSRTIVYPFSATIPAGTPIAAPITVPTQFEPNTVDRIEWTFPDGCNGQVGIQIGARNVPVIPTRGTGFFVSSGDTHSIDLTEMHDSGDWSVIGYNLGHFPHTIQVKFFMHRNIEPEPVPVHWMDSELSYTLPPYLET